MAMTKFQDFKRADGTVDWDGYFKAMIDNGETCCECRGIAKVPGTGTREVCHRCRELKESLGEVDHKDRLRCPKCRNVWGVDVEDHIYDPGEHEVWCPKCEHKFTIETHVEYSFTSPEIIAEETPNEAPKEV